MNNYLSFKKKEICCGCGICVAKCPAHCIKMQEDSEGFFYPEVDRNLCINCNLCAKICPFEKQEKNPKKLIRAFAAHSKDDAILENSSSGGIFSEIAMQFLNDGGCVCGATIDKEHQVYHIIIDDVKSISLLQGSKYVQSNMEGVLNKIGKLLKMKRKVLFCGTPCQVSAIKNAYKSDCLYFIDILCHGVPSQKLFDKYIEYLEKKHHGNLTGIWFRDKKKNGWSITLKYSICKKGKNKDYYLVRQLSEYFSGFLRNMTQRESCFNCPYTTIERCGDITLADFWGIEKIHPEYYCTKGTSIVLVNSDYGMKLLTNCKSNIDINPVTIDDVLVQNPQFKGSPKREKERNYVYNDIFNNGFKEVGKRYILPSNAYKYKIKSLIKSFHGIYILQLIQKIKKASLFNGASNG